MSLDNNNHQVKQNSLFIGYYPNLYVNSNNSRCLSKIIKLIVFP